MQYENTIVINLVAGPCAGKSTIASGIFYKLKMKGIDCEQTLEYAKDRVWEGSYSTMDDQIYMFGKQYHRVWRLNHKVQVIISDSPLILSIHYAKFQSKYFENFVIEQFKAFNNVTYFIERDTEYNENGRVHSLEDAKKADQELKDILDKNDIKYSTVKTTEATDIITDQIMEMLKKQKEIKKDSVVLLYETNQYNPEEDGELRPVKYTVNDMYSCLTSPLTLFNGSEKDKKLISELCKNNIECVKPKFVLYYTVNKEHYTVIQKVEYLGSVTYVLD